MRLEKEQILDWLGCEDESRLEGLWRLADKARKENVGDQVHLRGLIEFSNYCGRRCAYCGINAGNSHVQRYRMGADAILACVREAADYGYGTVVLQSGEDPELSATWMADLIRRIKVETDLAVTLSLGERSKAEWRLWKQAGADRYLLRFETSNPVLFERIHPSRPDRRSDRVAMLQMLKRIGYEIGSGVMIGIPGQSYEDLANDILLFRQLDLDMIGVGPYIPHQETPLGRNELPPAPPGEQVPNTELMTYKVVALARLVCPRANIPSTTALATLNTAAGRELGLQRGANVIMPNMTPPKYRKLYEIYPAKACIGETAEECRSCMKGRIESIGRTVGKGRGDAPKITMT